MQLRSATLSDLQELSKLCYRSKASWGYDDAFMLSCEEELTFQPQDLEQSLISIAIDQGKFVGVAEIAAILPVNEHSPDTGIELLKLFIDPAMFHKGVGRVLFQWAVSSSQLLKADSLFIIADPYARDFYEKMGANHAGHILSETMADRWLPFFMYPLKKPLLK
jgi:N-acetylglutamate synthase-like GNAT family acetyltransferase